MFGIQDLPLFLVSCVLLNITPGQDTLYILGRTMAQGRNAGLLSALGIMSGVLVHTLCAGLGLSVLLASSSLAFAAVKYAGGAYLIYLGVSCLRSGGHRDPRPGLEGHAPGPWKIYRQGMVTNILNPKVALFFLSFLPQFVDPQARYVFAPFVALGLLFFVTGSLWCTVLALGASWLTGKFRTGGGWGGLLRKGSGLLFVGLGVKLVFSRADSL